MTMQRWRSGGTMVPSMEDLHGLQRRIEDYLSNFGISPYRGESWIPVLDIYEKNDGYVVKAEIPGIKEEDVDVSVFGERLTIKGEKKAETEVTEENYYRSERSYGKFVRSVDLPPNVDTEKIAASYDDGILEIVIPKTSVTEVSSKKIPVSSKKK
jgi:HSP20 family protein